MAENTSTKSSKEKKSFVKLAAESAAAVAVVATSGKTVATILGSSVDAAKELVDPIAGPAEILAEAGTAAAATTDNIAEPKVVEPVAVEAPAATQKVSEPAGASTPQHTVHHHVHVHRDIHPDPVPVTSAADSAPHAVAEPMAVAEPHAVSSDSAGDIPQIVDIEPLEEVAETNMVELEPEPLEDITDDAQPFAMTDDTESPIDEMPADLMGDDMLG